MLIVNNVRVMSDQSILIDVDNTSSTDMIVSILLWDMDNFKLASKAIDVSKFIGRNPGKQLITIPKAEHELDLKKPMFFIELRTDNANEANTDLVVYDLSKYYRCLLESLLSEYSQAGSCADQFHTSGVTVMIDLLLTGVETSLSIGEYNTAIDFVNRLGVICSRINCKCTGEQAIFSYSKRL